MYNKINAISAYAIELVDAIQFHFLINSGEQWVKFAKILSQVYNGHHHKSRNVCFTFEDDLISHCQTITGGLDIEVSVLKHR